VLLQELIGSGARWQIWVAERKERSMKYKKILIEREKHKE